MNAKEAIERIAGIIESANQKSERISVTKACKLAGVSEASVYYILDNAERYGINSDLFERYHKAKNTILDCAIDRIRAISEGSDNTVLEPNTNELVQVDSALHLGRDKLKSDNEKWLLARLMPKQFSENSKLSLESINSNQVLDLSHLTEEQLRLLAQVKVKG